MNLSRIKGKQKSIASHSLHNLTTFSFSRCISFIGVLAVFGGIFSMFVLVYNFTNARAKKPILKTYLQIAGVFFILSGVAFAQALILYMDVRTQEKHFQGDCSTSIRDYSESFLQGIGCPQKYFKTTLKIQSTLEVNTIFNMDCVENDVALVWETDLNKPVEDKFNFRSCINLRCCNLIGEFAAVQFWTFIILTTFFVTNSIILFSLSLVIYTQKDRYVDAMRGLPHPSPS